MDPDKTYRGWSHMEERRLADLIARGVPRHEIAARLGRSVSAIGARIARLGVAALRRRTFSVSEDDAIRAARRAGTAYMEIARRLGRSEGAVKDRARRLGLALPRRAPSAGSKLPPRKCLRHGERFQPSHRLEFVCPACKESEEWQAGSWMN